MTTTRGKERQSILSHVFKQILSDPPIPSKKRTFEDVFTPSKCFPELWQTRQELREKEDLLLSKGRTTRAGRLRIERQAVADKKDFRQDAKNCKIHGHLHGSDENVNEGINNDMTKEIINGKNSDVVHKRKRQKSSEISVDKHSREVTNQLNTELDSSEPSCNDNAMTAQLTNHAKQVAQNNAKRKSRDVTLTESEKKKVKTAKPDVVKKGRGRPKKYATATSHAQATQLVHSNLAPHSPTHIETKVPRLRLILKKRCEQPLQPTDASQSSAPAHANDKKKCEGKTGLVPLDPLKESQLRSVLCTTKKQLSAKAARLKRKLLLRESKRAVQLPIFDIDIWIHNHMRSGVDLLPIISQSPQPNSSSLSSPLSTSQDTSQRQEDDSSRSEGSPVLQDSDSVNAASTERSEIESSPNGTKSVKRPLSRYLTSFASRIHGAPYYWRALTNPSLLLSTYTSTPLPPYVFRDYWTRPPKLLLLHSILTYPHRDKRSSSPPLSSPIDFCYFQPAHLLQVNELLQRVFWPGIDVSENLQYPEFSIIALYKRLVIGCGFVTPAGYVTYLAVSAGWEKSGIGKFMLYWLIQKCKGKKDVTLHVSANNNAMILYQTFGFKPEEFIVNFYDKYLPDSSWECKNAFFVRCRR